MKLLSTLFAAAILTGPRGELATDDVSRAQVIAEGPDTQAGSGEQSSALPDAGAPVIWSACVEPDAGDVAHELDGGYVVLSPARARFDACRIGSGAKCSELLAAGVDAGVVDSTKSHVWLVTSAICALSTLTSAYIQNRTARHLPILP